MVKVQTGADVRGKFKPLSEADIQTHTGGASFQKGYKYYLDRCSVRSVK